MEWTDPLQDRHPPRDTGRALAPLVRAGLLLATILTVVPGSAPAQQDFRTPDGFRMGLTLGGTSFVGVTLEYRWEHWSADLTLGTFGFQDLSVSLVGRHGFGAGSLRPVAGVGVWSVVALPREGGRDRVSGAFLLRAPVGIDWRAGGDHFLGAEINVNRGIWVRRADPDDEHPMSRRLVPLPGIHYRWEP